MAAKVDIFSDKLPEADTPLFFTTEENEATQRTQSLMSSDVIVRSAFSKPKLAVGQRTKARLRIDW